MNISMPHLLAARQIFTEHREGLIGIDDADARHSIDLLNAAIGECSELIRDRRRADEVRAQADHARGKQR